MYRLVATISVLLFLANSVQSRAPVPIIICKLGEPGCCDPEHPTSDCLVPVVKNFFKQDGTSVPGSTSSSSSSSFVAPHSQPESVPSSTSNAVAPPSNPSEPAPAPSSSESVKPVEPAGPPPAVAPAQQWKRGKVPLEPCNPGEPRCCNPANPDINCLIIKLAADELSSRGSISSNNTMLSRDASLLLQEESQDDEATGGN